MGSIRQRGNAWYTVVEGPRGTDGRRRQIWRRIPDAGGKPPDKRARERALAKAMAEADQGTAPGSGRLTVGAWMKQWLEGRHGITAVTRSGYEIQIRRHIIPGLGAIRLEHLRPDHVLAFHQSLRRQGLSERTVHHVHVTLSSALNRAVELGLVSRNVATIAGAPRPDKPLVFTPSIDDIQDLLAAIRPTRFYIPAVLAVGVGMRMGEILALRWAEVDLARGEIRIERAVARSPETGLVIKAPKSGKGRRVPIPDFVAKALREHQAAQSGVVRPEGWQEWGLVCPGPTGAPQDSPSFASCWRRKLQQLVLDPPTFHSLRHAHATIALELNIHPLVVSERLGHSTVQITLDTYSHVVKSIQEDAARRIGEALEPAPPPPNPREKAFIDAERLFRELTGRGEDS